MRLLLATATLFTIAFLATSMSNTESADRANAKIPLTPMMDEGIVSAREAENAESIQEAETEMPASAPENAVEIDSSVKIARAATSRDNAKQAVGNSLTRDLNKVREIRLEGESRSPVFIPEFSVASPWANVSPPETLNAEPLPENSSLARNLPMPRAMVAMRETAVSTRSSATPVRNSVPEVMEGSGVRVDRISQGDARALLGVPEVPSNPAPKIAAVPSNPNWVQPAIAPELVRTTDRPVAIAVPEPPPSPLPTLASGQSIPVPPPERISASDRSTQGSARDLLPIMEPSSTSSSTIAAVQSPRDRSGNVAQTRTDIYRPDPQTIEIIEKQVQDLEENAVVEDIVEASPSLTIFNPTGYGADRNTGYISATYQSRTRFVENDDGAVAIGFGFGDARELVGVEVSYTLASVFGENRDFGTGGFNVKVHREFPDDWAVAAGWNGVVFLGEDDGVEDSIYGTVTKVIRTRESIASPFSRVALTAGVGNGQFRSEEALEDDENSVNVFGSVAVRVAKPVSIIAEWTGQDLAVGASIAPFKNIPFVITPAVRDITGAGDGARFVLGAGLGFRF